MMESQRLIMNMKEMKCITYFKLKSILDLSEEINNKSSEDLKGGHKG